MSSCDYCFDGRHQRCGGRGDCSCSVCAEGSTPVRRATTTTTAAKPKARKSKPPTERKPRNARPRSRQPTGRKRGGQPITEEEKEEIANMVLKLVTSIAEAVGVPTERR